MNEVNNLTGEHQNCVGVVTPPEANQDTPKDTFYNTPKDSYIAPKDSCKISKAEDSAHLRQMIFRLTFLTAYKVIALLFVH